MVMAAVALLLVLSLSSSSSQLSASASLPLSAPVPVGKPGCNTTCGDVEVPYPFGFGPSHCYWPGLNLTCDTTNNTSHQGPRLLLGDGTLRVTEISLPNNTVRVVGKAGVILGTNTKFDNITYGRWNSFPFGRSFGDHGYGFSSSNELSLWACNVVAELLGNMTFDGKVYMLGSCSTFCDPEGDGFIITNKDEAPLCVAPVDWTPSLHMIELQIISLHSWKQAFIRQFPVYAVVAEKGWSNRSLLYEAYVSREFPDECPIVLRWGVKRGLRLPGTGPRPRGSDCPDDVRRKLCKSHHSDCFLLDDEDGSGYTCQCGEGYDGNPYLDGGCQDIDECKLPRQDIRCISGECINTIGSFYCGCPPGSYGDPGVRGGCVKNSPDELLAPSAPIGLAGCDTSCGKVQVPYPFGLGPAHCYLEGLNLTCDTSHDPPRLLLGDDGSFQVVNISLADSMVRVIRTLNFPNASFHSSYDYDYYNYPMFDYLPSIGEPYLLSPQNEFVFNGCGVQATLQLRLHGDGGDYSNSSVVLNCSCNDMVAAGGPGWPVGMDYCSGTNGCCHAPIFAGSTGTPMNVTFQDLLSPSPTPPMSMFFYAFLTEGSSSMMDQHLHMNLNREINETFRQMASPLVLQWAVKQLGFPPYNNLWVTCRQEHGGYTCQCWPGYDGNPYIPDGCTDIDECRILRISNACFGDCINLPGSYRCRCPRGTHGNASLPNGCRPSITGLSIGIGVGSGAGLILLALVAVYVIKKLKHRRSMMLKQKFFRQNRGQLLRQLVAHSSDIAERMIITLEDIEKATNNFDKSRELGGGGHGTVYKGILSDLHVVAIKKSKIAVQREIDEFINEVAILSQISHRNVVKLYGCCLETEVPLLVYEFVSNGTLDSHLHVEGAMSSLSWNDRLRIATEIAKAIAYLHSATSIPIIHRDIKSTNILLDDNLTSKVSDFGASRHIPVDRTGVTTNVQGTIGYLDPSYYYTGRLTEKSDVYSFGVLLVELLTRRKPYSCVSSDGLGLVAHFVTLYTSGSLVDILDHQVMQEAVNQKVTEVAALAVTCLKMTRDERPTMRQVELTLEAIQAKEQTSDNVAVETFEENIIRRMSPSDPEGRSIQGMTRRYSMEQEFLLSARYPR